MKIVIPKTSGNDVKVYLDDGRDVTADLLVERIQIDVAHNRLQVTLTCLAEVDIEVDDSRLVVRKPFERRPKDIYVRRTVATRRIPRAAKL